MSKNELLPAEVLRTDKRSGRLAHELAEALAKTRPQSLAGWGLSTGKHFTDALYRRAENLVSIGGKLARGIGKEAKDGAEAYRQGRAKTHAKGRYNQGREELVSLLERTSEFGKNVVTAVVTNPREAGPQLAILVITSVLVSGGPDGDGGAADLDLLFGIDAHSLLLSLPG